MQAETMPRRRQGRSRQEGDDLPSSETFTALVRHGTELLRSLEKLYEGAVNDAAWPPGGGGIHVSGGSVSNPTRNAALSEHQQQVRQDCRTAMQWVRQSVKAARYAEAALLGWKVTQPTELHPGATMSKAEFARLREKNRVHREREEDLRAK